MTRWLRLLGPLFAFGLVLGACSSDDSDTSDDSGTSDDTAACDGQVCIADLAFDPDALTVSVGDTVTWANIDGTDHTVTADDDAFDSGTLSDGGTFEQTFGEAGDFTYHCSIHSSMTGAITVE